MSIPKEPRQKMINMMYLVLTALLALNVSVEVLNAFKTVNTSLENSNTVVSEKNGLTYSAFDANLHDNSTKALAEIWSKPAYQVRDYAAAFSTYLESLKTQLQKESGLKIQDGKSIYNYGDLDAATRMFDQGGHGKKLYDSLKAYKAFLISELDPSNPIYANANLSKLTIDDMNATRAEFSKRLPIDLRIPKSETGQAEKKDSGENWTMRYFQMTPTVAALTILSKFENDVKNSESQVVDYLHKQIGEVKIKFDQFDAIVSPSATYVMPGDDLSVSAGIGAFSAAAKPTITIDGTVYPVDANGIATYHTKASGVGEKEVNVHIVYTKPDGTTDTKDVPVKYTVGVPSGASIFLQKMNVVYVAEDNPVTISGGSVGAEKVHCTFSNGTITKVSGDNYDIVPTTAGEGTIIVDAAGKKTPFTVRVKYLPDPQGFVGPHTGGAVSTAEFQADGGVLAKLKDVEFQSGFQVLDYKIAASGGGVGMYVEVQNTGARWTGQAAALVARCTPGTHVFIDNLRCRGKDNRIRELPGMIFTLK